MNRSTLMQTQPLSSSRNHQPRIRLAEVAPTSFFNSGRMANTVSLKSSSQDESLRSPVRNERTGPQVAAIAAPRSLSAGQGFMMHITIDANCAAQLRHLVMGTCGELLAFMRIQPI